MVHPGLTEAAMAAPDRSGKAESRVNTVHEAALCAWEGASNCTADRERADCCRERAEDADGHRHRSDGLRSDAASGAERESHQSPPAHSHRSGGLVEEAPAERSPATPPGAAASAEPEEQLTHLELETVYRDTVAGLLAADPLLGDLPSALTAAELRSLTALERGAAMAVLVNRGRRLTRVIVQRGATVRDLKAALRGAVELELARRGGRQRAISWRHVWRANWLTHGGRRLQDDNASLEQLGIGNKAEVGFVKRIRPKRGQRDKKGGQL